MSVELCRRFADAAAPHVVEKVADKTRVKSIFGEIRTTAENPAESRSAGPSHAVGQPEEAAGHTCMESARSTLEVQGADATIRSYHMSKS